MTHKKITNIGIIAALFLSLGTARCGKKWANKVPCNTKKWPISNKGVQEAVHNPTVTDSQKTTEAPEAQAENVTPPKKERPLHRATVHNLNLKDPQKTTEAQAENVPPPKKKRPRHRAKSIGDLEAMKRLITMEEQLVTEGKLRRKSQLRQRLDSKNSEELTQLGIAVRDNDLEAIKLLAENGALSQALQNKKNQMLIHEVVIKNRQSMLQALINAGAPLDKKDTRRRIPLHLAAMQGNQAMVQILTKNKAGVNLLDYKGWTPLHLAAGYGHLEVVKTLVKRGAALDLKDKNGCVPLHFAIIRGHTEIARHLIKKGADVNIRANNGYTPLHYATRHGHRDVMKALIDAKAAINAQDNLRRTPLHMAGFNGDQEAATLLIGAGAQTDIQDKKGKTREDYVRFGRQLMIRRLIIKKAKPRRSL